MLSREQELALVELARKDDEAAFTQLKQSFDRAVSGYINSIIEQKGDAEDILQNVWTSVWLNINLYKPEIARFYTFIRMIASYEIRNYFKRLKKRREKENLFSDLAGPADVDPENAPAEDIIVESLRRKQAGTWKWEENIEEELINKERAEEANDFYLSLLRTVFSIGGYPHQVIAFAFSKLIFPCDLSSDKNTTGRKSGCPERVVRELFDKPLEQLSILLEQLYIKYSGISKDEISQVFEILHLKMDKTLSEVVDEKLDKTTWNLLRAKGLLGEKVGRTSLRDYYETNNSSRGDEGGINQKRRKPEDAVSDWSYKVQQRVKKRVIKKQVCRI
ncbi:MAG: sigma-70 family RNA polymerase sigma factor [Bacillota bacterium]|nr:sigma-70 family RNA polymerase sigma factor [Bacillota bacterium]